MILLIMPINYYIPHQIHFLPYYLKKLIIYSISDLYQRWEQLFIQKHHVAKRLYEKMKQKKSQQV